MIQEIKTKILLAEDSPTISKIGKKTLEAHGFDVVTAFDGIQAIEEAYKELPDGILLDIHMPYLNGPQVLRLLKALDYFQDTPIIMLTGKEEEMYFHWTHTLGADAYYVKPQGLSEFSLLMEQISKFFLERKQEKKVKSFPLEMPKEKNESLAHVFDSLYQKLFAYNLHYQFMKQVEQSHNFLSLAQDSLAVLSSAFGSQIYFILLQEHGRFFVLFLSPFEKNSEPIQYCMQTIGKEYQKFFKTQTLPKFTIYADKIEHSFEFKSPSLYHFVSPICRAECNTPVSKISIENCLECERQPLGLLGIISNRPLIGEVEKVLRIIGRSIPDKITTLLLKEEMREMEPIKAYNQLLKVLNRSKNLEEILAAGMEEIVSFSLSQAALYYQMDSYSNSLISRKAFGITRADLLHQKISYGYGLVGSVAQKKTHLHLQASEKESLLEIDTGLGKIYPKEILFVPVAFQENLFGVLVLGSIYGYSSQTIEQILAMSSQFAIGINNAMIYQKATELAESLEKQNEYLKRQYDEIEKQQNQILKQQQELDQKNQELEKANQHKSEFLASMSHELRTPLNAIIGYTSLTLNALRGTIKPQHFENLIRSEEAARTLLQLINDVLDFSKIEAGKMDVFLEEFAMAEIIENCLLTAGGLILQKQIALKSEIEPDLPEITSDYTKIKQIITNLLSNAIKFTEKGHVFIKARRSQEKIEVVVEDTGCGIPEDKVGFLFESFKQMDGSIKKKFGGTGLGLAICKKLCNMLSISVEVKSKFQEGTQFLLRIPLKIEEQEVLLARQTRKLPKLALDQLEMAKNRKESSKKNILEDAKIAVLPKALVLFLAEKEKIADLQDALSLLPLEIVEVHSIQQCIEKASTNLVWAIVATPEMAKACKEEPALSHIPVFLSSLEKEELIHYVEMGGWDSILIVDDNEVNRNLLGEIFSGTGYTMFAASSGKEAIEIAREKRPHVILMDLAMPDMDGFESTLAIKNIPELSETIIIACSAFSTTKFKEKAFQVGCKGYIPKPIEPTRLIEQVKKIVWECKNEKSFAS